jgi:hypothetical protein
VQGWIIVVQHGNGFALPYQSNFSFCTVVTNWAMNDNRFAMPQQSTSVTLYMLSSR